MPGSCGQGGYCPDNRTEAYGRWNSLQFGNLATIVTTENRISARSPPSALQSSVMEVSDPLMALAQAIYDPATTTEAELAKIKATMNEFRNSKDRVMFGADQVRIHMRALFPLPPNMSSTAHV